jgi:hypothetical protein
LPSAGFRVVKVEKIFKLDADVNGEPDLRVTGRYLSFASKTPNTVAARSSPFALVDLGEKVSMEHALGLHQLLEVVTVIEMTPDLVGNILAPGTFWTSP